VTVSKSSWADTFDRQHFAALSIAAAITTIALKTAAWWVTDSVGLLSDALESFVNLAGASFALWMILITRLPPDDEHPFGHAKAEYFSSGFEGLLIFGAAAAIIWAALGRIVSPRPLEAFGLGLTLSGLSTLINLSVALALRRAAARFRSIALEADSRHLMTDVYTSIGVVVAIGAVWATGWLVLDPLVAIVVGVNILVTGVRLLRASVDGLMDRSLDEPTRAGLRETLDGFASRDVRWRNLRTRHAGTEAWIEVDVLVPGHWSVADGHSVLDEVEDALRARVPGANVMTHLEPHDEPAGPVDAG
jgi:cation diffusion facilitator family transporter